MGIRDTQYTKHPKEFLYKETILTLHAPTQRTHYNQDMLSYEQSICDWKFLITPREHSTVHFNYLNHFLSLKSSTR